MPADIGIVLDLPDGKLTLEPDTREGFRAFHHCGKMHEGVLISHKVRMNFYIGEGSGNYFHVSLSCPACLYRIAFLWKPETSISDIRDRILHKNHPTPSPPRTIRQNIRHDPGKDDPTRERIMRSISGL